MSNTIEVTQYEHGVLPTTLGLLPVAMEVGAKVQWFPVKIVARTIGVEEDKQVVIVKESYSEALRQIPMRLAVGWRDLLCIRRKEFAAWIGGIEPWRCKKASTREVLEAYRKELFAAADRLFWKHASLGSARAADPPQSEATVTVSVNGPVYCAHGSPHRAVLVGGLLMLELLEE